LHLQTVFEIVNKSLQKHFFFFLQKKKTKPLPGLRGRGAEPHSAKRKNKVIQIFRGFNMVDEVHFHGSFIFMYAMFKIRKYRRCP